MRTVTPFSLLLSGVLATGLTPAGATEGSPLVAYWPMTGSSSSVMQDVVAGQDGTIGRGVLTGPGIYGFTGQGEVTIPSDPSLDPGLRPFRVTVRLAVAPNNWGDYSVIQKGLWLQGGEWKMQVTNNFPGCTFGSLKLFAPTINDARFHTISCIRMPTYIAIQVDSSIYGLAGKVGNLGNDFPVTVGGKPPNQAHDHDYYFGYMTGISILKY